MVTAAYVRGVAHPPGYPLYTFLAWIATYIPYSTVSWRVSLLSSVPMSLALGFLYLILHQISKSKSVSIITTFVFGFSYLVWLYAITPEVFAMYILFLTVFIWLMLNIQNLFPNKHSQIYFLAFYTGLNLTHHHTILFILPAIIYYLYPKYQNLFKKPRWDFILKTFVFFCVGLLPYIYVYFAALGHPVLNWENPVTLDGFIRLISRSIYGSFRSNAIYTATFSDRIRQISNFFESLFIDFKIVGLLSISGFYVMYRTQKKFAVFSIFAFLLSGPLYFFMPDFLCFLIFIMGLLRGFFWRLI